MTAMVTEYENNFKKIQLKLLIIINYIKFCIRLLGHGVYTKVANFVNWINSVKANF